MKAATGESSRMYEEQTLRAQEAIRTHTAELSRAMRSAGARCGLDCSVAQPASGREQRDVAAVVVLPRRMAFAVLEKAQKRVRSLFLDHRGRLCFFAIH